MDPINTNKKRLPIVKKGIAAAQLTVVKEKQVEENKK
jgi:hypothetical protein